MGRERGVEKFKGKTIRNPSPSQPFVFVVDGCNRQSKGLASGVIFGMLTNGILVKGCGKGDQPPPPPPHSLKPKIISRYQREFGVQNETLVPFRGRLQFSRSSLPLLLCGT